MFVEGNDIRWSEYIVLNCMGSDYFKLNRLAFSISHLVFDG